MSIPRVRFLPVPVDVSSLLIGQSVATWTVRDFSSFLPPSAGAMLIRRRSAPDRVQSGVLGIRPNGSIVDRTGPNAVALDINRVQNTNITLVPDTLIWGLEKWTRLDGLNRVQMRRSAAGSIPGGETLTLIGYGEGGKCFEPLVSPVDISAVLPGDTVTAPATVDLTPYLPAGITAGAVMLTWDCRVNSGQGTKGIYTRETGTGITSAVLCNPCVADDRVSLSRGFPFTVRCDGSNQIDLWYGNTTTTFENTLTLRGYYLKETKG